MVYFPTFTIKNQLFIGKYTFRPMDGSWVTFTVWLASTSMSLGAIAGKGVDAKTRGSQRREKGETSWEFLK